MHRRHAHELRLSDSRRTNTGPERPGKREQRSSGTGPSVSPSRSARSTGLEHRQFRRLPSANPAIVRPGERRRSIRSTESCCRISAAQLAAGRGGNRLHGWPAGPLETAGDAWNVSAPPSPRLGWRNRTSCADPLHWTESVPTNCVPGVEIEPGTQSRRGCPIREPSVRGYCFKRRICHEHASL